MMTKIKKKDEEITWASLSVAAHCLLQIWTRSSPILWLFDDISCSCLGSTVASNTAFTPRLPIANLAVNCRSTFSKDMMMTITRKLRKEPGHPAVLQTIVSSKSGHVAPPFSECWMTSRALVLVPPLQVTLQSPQGFQSPTSQSTENPHLVKI